MQILREQALEVFTLFYKHNFVSKTKALQENFEDVVRIGAKSLVKVGIPSLRNDPSCEYSKTDFETDAEFNVQFMKVRAKVLYLARLCAQIRPNFVFQQARGWLLEIFQNFNSSSEVELEAMPKYWDAVLQVVKQSEDFQVFFTFFLLSNSGKMNFFLQNLFVFFFHSENR